MIATNTMRVSRFHILLHIEDQCLHSDEKKRQDSQGEEGGDKPQEVESNAYPEELSFTERFK